MHVQMFVFVVDPYAPVNLSSFSVVQTDSLK